MITLNRLLTVRGMLLGCAVLLGLLGVGNAFVAIFAPARYEVVYQFDVTVSYCTEARCAYSALLSVANTGRRPQDAVTLVVEGLPAGFGGRARILSLDATIDRGEDPVIERENRDAAAVIRLKNFNPGTLVQIPFSGTFPESSLSRALEPEITVQSRGRVVRGDPRSIALGRWFTHATGTPGPSASEPPRQCTLCAAIARYERKFLC